MSRGGKHKVTEHWGRKKKKRSLLFFYQSFAETSQKNYILHLHTNPGQRPQAHKIKETPREILISITKLGQAGEIWRKIKEDLRIIILVGKLDTAMPPNRTGRFDTDPVAVS